MPLIYLSPSTQESNIYVTGGSEEYHMNQLADALEPYLRASGIRFIRNTPEMTAVSSLRQSNASNVDLHLALHSNAAPEGRYGELRGIDVYYHPNSTSGRRAAQIFVRNFKDIYPQPNLVRAAATTRLGEVRQTNAPAVFLEIGYHDNTADANWITSDLDSIARKIALSLTQYFGIPFIEPQPMQQGAVVTQSGNLNIRNRPSRQAAVIGSVPTEQRSTYTGNGRAGSVVSYNGVTGYASGQYIRI